ncbi:MAG: chorismate-binding protein [Dehalococcoidia bacterium]
MATSSRWCSPALLARDRLTHFEVYRSLRTINPSPYMYYLQLEQAHLHQPGASPELLVKVEEGACREPPDHFGTRPDGTPLDDQRLAEGATIPRSSPNT